VLLPTTPLSVAPSLKPPAPNFLSKHQTATPQPPHRHHHHRHNHHRHQQLKLGADCAPRAAKGAASRLCQYLPAIEDELKAHVAVILRSTAGEAALCAVLLALSSWYGWELGYVEKRAIKQRRRRRHRKNGCAVVVVSVIVFGVWGGSRRVGRLPPASLPFSAIHNSTSSQPQPQPITFPPKTNHQHPVGQDQDRQHRARDHLRRWCCRWRRASAQGGRERGRDVPVCGDDGRARCGAGQEGQLMWWGGAGMGGVCDCAVCFL